MLSATLAVILVLVVGFIMVFAAIAVPVILSVRIERMRHKDFIAEASRQDHVSERLEIRNSEAVSTAKIVNDKLDVIHVLVNSNMTRAMQSELDATVGQLALMREIVGLRRAAGQVPEPSALIAIRDTETKVSELRAVITDRENPA